MDHYQLLIGGERVDAKEGARFETVDPGTGQPIATVAQAGESDVDDAVAAARRAFDSGEWSRLDPADRAERVIELADLLQAQIASLAFIEAVDSGGVVARTGSDVFQGARFLRAMARYAAHEFPWTERVHGRNPFFPATNTVRREPVGVCAAIIPWNFPLLMALWKLGMTLVTGNTIVLKPSPETPLSALTLGRLLDKTRIPPGVVNIVVAPGREVGEALCRHPDVDRVAFTGSTATGKQVLKTCADTLKRVSLELGGKSANIVLDDANPDLAVDGTIFGAFLHSGQVCESGTRLLLPESRYDEFLQRLTSRTKELKIGYQLDRRTRIGPVVSKRQRDRIEGYIELGREEGAQLLCGGERPAVSGHEGGFYVAPTIFADVKNDMRIAQEEIFGPVLSVLSYKDEEEAIAMANDSSYGLAGGVWSRDLERAEHLAARVRTGTMWINDWHVFHDHAPFGGFKQSGIGREMGHYGLEEYTEIKHVHSGAQLDPDAKRGHRLLVDRPASMSYDYEPTTRVLSGPESLPRLRAELDEAGKHRVLVITDRGMVEAGLLERLRSALGSRIAAVYDEVPQDSSFEAVDGAAARGREANVDAVVSFGGGSVIDTTKATAVALSGGLRAAETIGIEQLTGRQLFHAAVPTTAGTGSEVTQVAVLRNSALRIKSYIVDRFVVPDLAVLDPTLTTSLPARMTAGSGMDAMTHAIEAYIGLQANPMADAQALHAVRLIATNLPRVTSNGEDLEARSQMQSAATLAGWAIRSSNVGLVHGMCHTVGARYGVPHGIGNGILLPHVLRYHAEQEDTHERLGNVAQALGVDTRGTSVAEAANAAADAVSKLLGECKHPVGLAEVGVPRDELDECSQVAFVDMANIASPRRPKSPAEIRAIYDAAM